MRRDTPVTVSGRVGTTAEADAPPTAEPRAADRPPPGPTGPPPEGLPAAEPARSAHRPPSATARPTLPSQRSAARERGALWRAAAGVLSAHWTGSATVPSRTLYPHQWSWDSAFIAIGLRHLSPRRAQCELETLLGAQWRDGRVPHIVFNPSVPPEAYFPGPGFWRSSRAGRAAGAPLTVETSGLVQPPVHALAAWLVHQADPVASRRSRFLNRVHPRLTAWHRYLVGARNLGGGGLAAIVHPWEPGLDNSPTWDEPLRRTEPVDRAAFHRADLVHGVAADRPTDRDYGRYVRLAGTYRDHGYADARAPHDFAVEDPCFNALLIASAHALAAIAEETGADPTEPRRQAAALTRALVERLWDPAAGVFAARDLHSGRLVGGYSVAGLVPLLVPGLPRECASALLDTARGERFRLGRVHMVPSYDLTAPQFDGGRYWRGPSWFNTAWLLHRGLVQHGEPEEAHRLRGSALRAAEETGFAEYVEPHTGAGHGIRPFGWTAALALDLLAGDLAGGPVGVAA